MSVPFNVIFASLFNQLDAFKHISDVINAPLLHFQLLDGHIQVQGLVRRFLKELHKSQS